MLRGHTAIFLSLFPPPLLGIPPFPPKEFLESCCTNVVWICSLERKAALKFLFLLFCLQRSTDGHTTAGHCLSLTSAPRLPIPGVSPLMFQPATLLLATAEAAGRRLQGWGHLTSSLPPHSCSPKQETFLSFTESGNNVFS